MHPTVSLLRPSNLPPCHRRLLPLPAESPAAVALLPPAFSATQFRCRPLHSNFLAAYPLHSTATVEAVETAKSGSEGLVEVGKIASVHGVYGEICLEPRTDFPELRFSKPGRRWLKQYVYGEEVIKEVELVEGWEKPGKKIWVLRLEGFETVDQAKQLIGSTLLVSEDDRPELEEGEFYTRDLVGMKVILKDTSTCIGTVIEVFNTGASDILRVMLYPSADASDATEMPVLEETGVSGRLVWVPFVEAIVPDVDLNKREMWITPPKGLLELNKRSHEISKKERRQLEWKERKKSQRQLIAAKKKLSDMEQKHVFDGLRYGEKSQRSLLASEIVAVNSNLLQHALKNIGIPSSRWSAAEFVGEKRAKLKNRCLKVSRNQLSCVDNLGANLPFHEKGCHLVSEGKLAIFLILNNLKNEGGDSDHQVVESKSSKTKNLCSFLSKALSDDQTFVKMEDRGSVPLVLVCPEHEIKSLKELFTSNDFFAFDYNKVWFLEEEKLPVVTISADENGKNEILMKSPWEVLKAPVGSGGVLQLLSTHAISNTLSEMGVKYIEVCSTSNVSGVWSPLFAGLVDTKGAALGVRISQGLHLLEESFDFVFSVEFAKSLANKTHKLRFEATPTVNSHVRLVEKEWQDVVPSSPNSYELGCSIYSSMNACPLEKVCMMEIAE